MLQIFENIKRPAFLFISIVLLFSVSCKLTQKSPKEMEKKASDSKENRFLELVAQNAGYENTDSILKFSLLKDNNNYLYNFSVNEGEGLNNRSGTYDSRGHLLIRSIDHKHCSQSQSEADTCTYLKLNEVFDKKGDLVEVDGLFKIKSADDKKVLKHIDIENQETAKKAEQAGGKELFNRIVPLTVDPQLLKPTYSTSK